MRIVCFVNNVVGLKVLRFLKERGEEIAAVVMHPPSIAKSGLEIAALADWRIILADRLQDPETLKLIRELEPDLGVSAYFGYLLRNPVLDLFPRGVLNLHPGFLPFCRGSNTNVWPIVEGTPAGVTVHWMDERIDSGPIVAQQKIPVYAWDTGETLYRLLEDYSFKLFESAWPACVQSAGTPQCPYDAVTHKKADLELLDQIDLDTPITPRRLLNRIRARTFSGYRGCYFEADGRRVYVSISLEAE